MPIQYKFSFVMAYHNRKQQLISTLKSIDYFYKDKFDFEVIIADDASNDNIEYLTKQFPFLKIIKISKEEKGNRLNACVPYNIGFSKATGEIIIIQNPENIHIGNILNKISENLFLKEYASIACYSLTKKQTDNISNFLNQNDFNTKKILDIINPINNTFSGIFENGWYNHSRFNPTQYHFMSAIFREDLYSIGGFDEIYSDGTSYDDNELLFRIKLKYKIKTIDLPFCAHQWHEHNKDSNSNFFKLNEVNKSLFEETKRRNTWVPQKSRLL